MTRVRVGIDVGGTFTHAVAIDNQKLEVLAHAVHPTTHSGPEGVAAGIVEVFRLLQSQLPQPHEVVFLAHSTTQATNAMLEGDVVKVAILGFGGAMDLKARSDLEVGKLELAPGKYLTSKLTYLSDLQAVPEALRQLAAEGYGAVVAAQPFSVDDPTGENEILRMASEQGLPACATHEMSGLYGLRVRTRTAVLNASILPKMIETAVMTERSLRSLHVDAALMIMRSDGGVMSLEEVRRRPMMTLLSGPAAGIAAALVFLRASDALFLEVGGTSTDICLVKDGRAALRSATLGGHPTYLKTLDSRTLGIAGGSMVRREGKGLEVGPRSAHLAGCRYAAFSQPEMVAEAVVQEVSPLPGDPAYLILQGSERIAVTTTCAANYLGYVSENGYSHGNRQAILAALEKLGETLKMGPEALARAILDQAAAKVVPTLQQLIGEYAMKDRALKLIGGGGGAAAIVPVVAELLKLPYEIAPRAEVISAIGAALAMVKETVERNLLNPSQADLAALRSEAEHAVLKMGADPGSISVTVEVDAQRNLVRATATGSVEFVAQDLLEQEVDEETRLRTLKEASPREETYQLVGRTPGYCLYQTSRIQKALFNLLKSKKTTLWVTDARGNVKLQVPGGKLQEAPAGTLFASLERVLTQHTSYGDAGALIPALHVLAGRKLVDLTALQTGDQVIGLARQELGPLAVGEEQVYFLVHPRA